MRHRLPYRLLFPILLLLLASCASTGFLMAKPKVIMFTEAGPPKPEDYHLDVYHTTLPEQPYTEMARIECRDTNDDWNMKQIIKSARAIGADAVILVGRAGSYGMVTGTTNTAGTTTTGTTLAVGSDYGLAAVAIRFR